MLANFGKRRQERVGHIFSKVKKFINFRVTRNNTVYPQMRTREWKKGTISLLLLLSQTSSGNFSLLNAMAVFRLKSADWYSTRGQGLASATKQSVSTTSLSPTNDILSIISIFSNYDLQLGRKNVFNMGRISLFFFFFFFYQFFLSRWNSFVFLKIKRKISLLFIHLRGGEEADRS